MPVDKNAKIKEFEQSLINHLVQKVEVKERVPGGLQRVRGLSMGINLKDPRGPMYTVQIGMMEVAFNIDSGLKEKGSLYGIEKYIMDWYRKNDVSKEIQSLVKQIKKGG